jgi:hypothetical protein
MADTPNKKPTVASPSSAYLRMAPRWRMIDVLLGGTEAMRVAELDHPRFWIDLTVDHRERGKDSSSAHGGVRPHPRPR